MREYHIFRFIVVIVLSSMALGCESESPSDNDDTRGSIYGQVTDFATGEPIQYVNVQLRPSGETTLTGKDGTFEFISLLPGRYSLSLSKAEYLDIDDDYIIELTSDKLSISRDIQMKKQVASLSITDTDGNDISILDFGYEESVFSKSFNIFNNGTISIACQLIYTCSWIVSVTTPPNTIYPGQTANITVIIDRDKLSAGENSTYLHVTSNNGSKDLQITAIGNSEPSVYMSSVSSVGFEDATLYGQIVEVGLPPYSECGFVVGQTSKPTVSESLQTITFPASNSKEFSRRINGLLPRNSYYVRAYATNSNGTVYSNELEFSTRTPEDPVITTLTPSNIYETGATMRGTVQSTGNPEFIGKGFVVSASNDKPTLNNSSGWTISGSKTGIYTLDLIGFPENNTNYVRAFAITPYDTVYYNVVQFVTKSPYKVIGNLGVRLEDEYDYEYGEYKMSHYSADRLCDKLVLGDYDDWHLPTVDELKIVYAHRNEIGGFSPDIYWTSTKNKDEGNYEGGAWDEGYVAIDFSTGQVKYNNPYVSYSYRVRAVRSITPSSQNKAKATSIVPKEVVRK